MSALAEQRDTAFPAESGPGPERSEATPARPGRSARPDRRERQTVRGVAQGTSEGGGAWNVLAEELVAYPPAAQRIWLEPSEDSKRGASLAVATGQVGSTGLSAGERWLEEELERLRGRRAVALAPRPAVALAPRPAVVYPLTVAEPEPLAQPLLQPGGAVRHQRTAVASPLRHHRSGERRARAVAGSTVPTRTGAVLVGPRGLRRLLPGVATLAALAGLWAGAGALASASHHVTPTVLPGSVPARNGMVAYTARPGDTLWSIATRVEGKGDPRPLVDELEQQLGGAVLQPGDRLLLPR